MKTGIRIALILLLVHTTMMWGNPGPPPSSPPADFPEEVSALLTNSCYDCHSTGAEAEKAVKAMDFKIWEEYKLTRRITLLTKICEVIEEGDMPPGKYLKQYPGKALSEDDVKLICKWTSKEAEKLVK
jgi:hypothetical protein